MSRRVFPALFAGLMVVASSVVLPAIADAQSRTDLERRLRHLELDLQEVQRRMFAPGEPAAAASAAPAGRAAATAPGAWAARAEIRLQQLETQIRTLSGRVEELRFALDEAVTRLDSQALQLQARPAPPPASEPAPDESGQPAATAAALAAAPGVAAAAAAQPAAGKPGVIGYLSSQDLRRSDTAQQQPAAAAGSAAAPTAAAIEPQKQYEQAFALLVKHDYAGAEAAFRDFVAANDKHPLAGNAMYWLGETHYVREQFSEAANAFATGYETYSSSTKTADNLFKLGLSLAQLQRNDDACVAFAQFHHEFPDAAATLKRRAAAEEKRLNCPG